MRGARFAYPALRLAVVLCLMGGLLLIFEKRFIYFPTRDHDATPSALGLPHEDVWLVAEDGVRIHGWYLPVREARWVTLVSHGNGGNISHRLDRALLLQHHLRSSVFLYDYRGYGASEGSPDEAGTVAAWAKQNEVSQPWFAWSYAVEAKLATNVPRFAVQGLEFSPTGWTLPPTPDIYLDSIQPLQARSGNDEGRGQLQINRNCIGQPLMLKGVVYKRGVGEHALAELFHRSSVQPTRKSNRTCLWLDPRKVLPVFGEEFFGGDQILTNNAKVAGDNRLFSPQRDDAQHLARRAIADGGVVFVAQPRHQLRLPLHSQPAKAQARQGKCFGQARK